jgi:Putative prokaryotic signal transducing protein
MHYNEGMPMKEVLRTNDPVFLSYAEMILREADLHPVVFDQHASVLDGSVIAIQRRLMVLDEEETEARDILTTAKTDYDSGDD